MDEQGLWELIEAARGQVRDPADAEAVAVRAAALLSAHPPGEIVAAGEVLWGLLADSYRHPLWAAAYLVNGGCSDDGFEYFRRWLIGQGEAVYTAALRDPESLLSVVTSHIGDAAFLRYEGAAFLRFECELLGNAAVYAYEQKTASEMPHPPRPQAELIGEDWDDEDLPAMFPRLWAVFE